MTNPDHERARTLIDATYVEGITASDRAWLDAHLENCPECARRVQATERALRSLRLAVVPVSAALVARAQDRVRLRAWHLREHRARMRAVWVSCALSWLLGALTAPLVWRGFEWLGQRLALPSAVWITGFVFWWITPAAVVGAVLAWRHQASEGDRDAARLPW